MAYGNESWISLPMAGFGDATVSTDYGALGAKLATISAGEIFAEYPVGYPKVILKRMGFLVGTAMTSAGVIKVWKNGTSGTLLGTLTLGASGAGTFAYEDASSLVTLDAGDYISFELDAQDSSAGTGWPVVLVEPAHETPANISDMSAV